MKRNNYLLLLVLAFSVSCTQTKESTVDQNKDNQPPYSKGTFGYDLDLVQKHREVVVLKDKEGKAQVITSPELQGRVLTSSFNGLEGMSLGYINHERIASTEMQPHIQSYGGEDRFWLGPQGGQYTVYFNPSDPFDFDHWFTPSPIDKEPFELVSASDSLVQYRKSMQLKNYVNTIFDLEVNREIKLLDRNEALELLGLDEISGLNYVGFESINKVTNTGSQAWEKDKGLLSIWILGMFPGGSTVVIPFKEDAGRDIPVYTEYFTDIIGTLEEDNLRVKEGVIYYKGDGNYIGKIGVGAKRAKPFFGSYDEEKNVLTIILYTLPQDTEDYVNSQWEEQEKPYAGDVVNSYNDGALDHKPNPEPTFYELESSSPAMELKPGESMVHHHLTFHFSGSKEQLNKISQARLGTSIEEIERQF